MKLIKVKTYEELSKIASEIVEEQILKKPDCVLGLATGSSPIGLYDNLIADNKTGKIDFSKVTTVNLDEYFGLSGDNDQSYRYFMNEHLFNYVNIDKSKTFVPSGNSDEPEKECKAYDELIKSLGGIDLQVLGIGNNGHIGFNEPSNEFSDGTHVTELTESTIKANARFFADISLVPTKALTMGIGTIMSAKKIVLVANGKGKVDAVTRTVFGEITPNVPASILQNHPDCTIIFSDK